jgi:hypothetical protein
MNISAIRIEAHHRKNRASFLSGDIFVGRSYCHEDRTHLALATVTLAKSKAGTNVVAGRKVVSMSKLDVTCPRSLIHS